MSSLVMRPWVARPTAAFGALPAIALLLCASLLVALEVPSKPFLDKNSFYLSSAGFRVQVANDAAGKKALRIVLKSDVQGSLEAIVESLKQIPSNKVDIEFIHTAAGPITESDVLLASASQAVIIGFNTRADVAARKLAAHSGVDIRYYTIIYEAVDEVKAALTKAGLPLVTPPRGDRLLKRAPESAPGYCRPGRRSGRITFACVVAERTMSN